MTIAQKRNVSNITLETQRLFLKPIAPEDLNDLAILWSDPDVMRYLRTGQPRPIESVRNGLEYWVQHWQKYGFGVFRVAYRSDPETMIGYCGLQYPCNIHLVEIMYGFAAQYWGKRLASEAAQAVLRFAFEKIKLDQVIAAAFPGNLASCRIIEGLGLTDDPQLQCYGPELRHYSCLRQNYHPQSAPHL